MTDLSAWLPILPTRYDSEINGYTGSISDLVTKKANLLSELTAAEKTAYAETDVPATIFSLNSITRDSLVDGGTISAITTALNNASGGWGTTQASANGTIIPAISAWWGAKLSLYDAVKAINITTAPGTIIPAISAWWGAKLELYDALKVINISDYTSRILCPGETSCDSTTINTLENESYATLISANTEADTRMRLNNISGGWGNSTNTRTLEIISTITKWSNERLDLLTAIQSLKSFLWVARAEHDFTKTPTTGLIADIINWTGSRVKLYTSLKPFKNLLWLATESLKFNSGNTDNIISKIKTLTQYREELYTSLTNLRELLWAVKEDQIYTNGDNNNIVTKIKNWTAARVTQYNSLINLKEVLWLSDEYTTENSPISNKFYSKVKAWVDAKKAIFPTISPLLKVSPQFTITESLIQNFTRTDYENLYTSCLVNINSISSLLGDKNSWGTSTIFGLYTKFIANQKIILNWSKSLVDYFDSLEKKTLITTKLSRLNTIYSSLSPTATALQALQVQFKLLENNYTFANTNYDTYNALKATSITDLNNYNNLVHWENARIDAFKALIHKNELIERKTKLQSSINAFKSLDIETYKQAFINAQSAYTSASLETTSITSNLNNDESNMNWEKARVDLKIATEKSEMLHTQWNNFKSIVDNGKLGASIEMESVIVKAKLQTLSDKVTSLTNRRDASLQELNWKNGLVNWRKARLEFLKVAKLTANINSTLTDISGLTSNKSAAPKSIELEIATVNLSNASGEKQNLLLKESDSNNISKGLTLLTQYNSTVIDYLESKASKESTGQDIKYLKSLHDLEINEKQNKYSLDLSGALNSFNTLKGSCNASAEPFLLLTSSDLFGLDGAANIHSNEGFPNYIIARVYPDKTIMGKTHFINSDNSELTFRNPVTLPSPLNFKIQRYNSGITGSVISQECQVIIEIVNIQ